MGTLADFTIDAAGDSSLAAEFHQKLTEGTEAISKWFHDRGYNIDISSINKLKNLTFAGLEETIAGY